MKNKSQLAHPLSINELEILLQDVDSNKNKLIEHSLRMVIYVANKYKLHEQLDDLCQIGCIGLIKALNNMGNIDANRYYYHVKEYVHSEIEKYLERATFNGKERS